MPNAESTPDLSGKIALISGASKGLGRAMALALSEAGATIALVSRDAEKLQNVKQEIESSGGKTQVFVADVANEEKVRGLESEISAQLGKVQILINNAGINIRKNLVDFSLDEWQNGSRYKPHQRVSDVPRICSAHEGNRLWANTEYDLHHESCLASGPHCLFREQSRTARSYSRPSFGACR